MDEENKSIGSQQFHPQKGAGRDMETQKNLIRKIINTMESNHKDSTDFHKEKVDIAEQTNTLLSSLVGAELTKEKDKQSEKGDKKEEEVERKGLFKKLANLPTALKDGVQRVKDAPSNLMGTLGKKVKGFGGMLGKLASGAGIGILAIVATAGLMSSGLIDGEKVKKNVLSLLSIGNEMDVAKLATLVAFPTAMKQLAMGLVFFSAGGGIAGMTQGLLDKFEAGDWANTTKKNVLTLLSIGESLDAKKLITLGFFKPAMMALGLGLAAFGAGEAIAGIGQMVGFDANKLKDQVGILLSIGQEVGSIGEAAWLIAFAPAMTALGVGLAAFGIGSGIAGVAQLTSFDAQKVKDQVTTLLSIPEGMDSGLLGMLGETGAVTTALLGLGVGLGVFGAGQVVKALGDFFSKEDFAENTKKQVETLLSIGGDSDIVTRSANVSTALGSLSAGLIKFTGGNFISSLANAATGILNFLTGGESPVEQMMKLADREEEIGRVARNVDKLQGALGKLSNLKLSGGDFDIEGMLQSFGHIPSLLKGLAHGGKIEFETFGRNKKIDFQKGILDPSLQVPQINKVMGQVNSALGIGPARNPEIVSQSNQNAELRTDQMMAGGDTTGVVTVAPTTNNNVNSAVYGDPSPASDDLDLIYV
jgi:hypothetical protein